MSNTEKLKSEINELRNLLDSLVNDISSNDIKYSDLLDISKRMDILILEYLKMKK